MRRSTTPPGIPDDSAVRTWHGRMISKAWLRTVNRVADFHVTLGTGRVDQAGRIRGTYVDMRALT